MDRFNCIIQKRSSLVQHDGHISHIINALVSRFIKLYYHCDFPGYLNLKGVYFCHEGFNIVINPNAAIGEGTYIQHGVAIGSRDDIGDTKAPIIGRN